MKKTTRLTAVSALILALVVGYLAGSAGPLSARSKSDIYSRLDIFAKVLHYVETNYVDPLDQGELINGAIKGMLDILDPHTVFMPPDIYKEMKIDTTGEFQGLGLLVEIRNSKLVVVTPLDNSPASAAGLKRGDIIVAINERETSDISLAEAVNLMRGRIGSKVILSYVRRGQDQVRQVELVRTRIRVTSVEHHLLEPGIGYLRINSFQDRTRNQMVAAIKDLKLNSGAPLKGLVFDLRDNPGGLLDEAVRVVDEFITTGNIVTTEGRNHSHIEVEKAHDFGNYLKGDVALLINGGSASAAEIVAGAMQDHKRAVLFGSQSFGKGSVQNIIDLDDGSGLKITVARYFTPNRRSIDAIGIEPDVKVASTDSAEPQNPPDDPFSSFGPPEVTDETANKLLLAAHTLAGADQDDRQLLAAYAYLKNGKRR